MKGDVAGQSAGEMAQRAREKIARLERYADAWESGAAGERATGRVLDDLDPATWRVLHDVRWPGRARANLDHVVVGPPGVLVIDTKNWSGDVVVRGGRLRQNGRSRERHVVGVSEAAAAVRRLVPGTPVHPVLCVVRDEPAEGAVRNVRLCSTGNLRELVTSRQSVLDATDVARVADAVEAGVRRPEPAPPKPPRRSPRREKPAAVKPARKAPRRNRPSLVRALVGFVVMGVLLAGVQTGLYFDAFSRIGEVVSDQVTTDPPPDKPARKPAKDIRQQDGRQGKAQQDGQPDKPQQGKARAGARSG